MQFLTFDPSDSPEKRARYVDAFVAYGGTYSPTIPDPTPGAAPGATIPNPQSRAAYMREVMRGVARDIVRQYERNLAVAQAAALPDPDAT